MADQDIKKILKDAEKNDSTAKVKTTNEEKTANPTKIIEKIMNDEMCHSATNYECYKGIYSSLNSLNLFEIISATKIDDNGIAADNSLRDIEVVLPISLKGEIQNVSGEIAQNLKRALEMIKRIGLNRNRGLGRCEFKVKELR